MSERDEDGGRKADAERKTYAPHRDVGSKSKRLGRIYIYISILNQNRAKGAPFPGHAGA